MADLFLQFFPACALMVTWFFITWDNREKEDRRVRRALHGKLIEIDGKFRILQEDGKALCDLDIATYFDELPRVRRA